MSLDPVVIGFLGRALSFEFSAVQQYLSLAKLLQTKGLVKESEKFRHEAQEELSHAERIITRLIGFGCAPSATQLRPAKLRGSLVQVILGTSQLENDIVALYTQAVRYCEKNNDIENRIFFETLLNEEKSHYSELHALAEQMASGNYV